jgi:uncharacterized protein YdcH (DUF465 family)
MRTLYIVIVGLVCAVASLSGCASAGVAMRESLGIPKREQLVDRVKEARDSQDAAKKQFESALDEFLVVTGQKGQPGKVGNLEAQYGKFKSERERCDARAKTVSERIASVEVVSDKLFAEWRDEIKQFNSDDTRRASQRLYDQSHDRYDNLHRAMKAAESKMKPVLAAFKDQELFLKHNLNAQAIASLSGTVQQIQMDVTNLIRDMEASISEANKFIEQMGKE